MQELIAYETFSSAEAASGVAEKLEREGITTKVVKNVRTLGTVFVGSDFSDGYTLQIPGEDFNKANQLLYDNTHININELVPNHPLLAMSNGELKDIVKKPDEWGAENYNIAKALLKNRGINIPDKPIAQIQEERIGALSEKKSFNRYLLFTGYACAFVAIIFNLYGLYNNDPQTSSPLYFIWYFPGFGGLLIGWIILRAKTTLPNGARIATYNDATIKHGLAIFVLNILSWVINTILFMFLIF